MDFKTSVWLVYIALAAQFLLGIASIFPAPDSVFPRLTQLYHTGKVVFEISQQNVRQEDRCHSTLFNCSRPSTSADECSLSRAYRNDGQGDPDGNTWYCAIGITSMSLGDVGVYRVCKINLHTGMCDNSGEEIKFGAWETRFGYMCTITFNEKTNERTNNCSGLTTSPTTTPIVTTTPLFIHFTTALTTDSGTTLETELFKTSKNKSKGGTGERGDTTDKPPCYGPNTIIVTAIGTVFGILLLIALVFVVTRRFRSSRHDGVAEIIEAAVRLNTENGNPGGNTEGKQDATSPLNGDPPNDGNMYV